MSIYKRPRGTRILTWNDWDNNSVAEPKKLPQKKTFDAKIVAKLVASRRKARRRGQRVRKSKILIFYMKTCKKHK